MSEEKFGIDNLQLIIPFPVELGNIADKIGHANSKDWKKWFELVAILDECGDLLKVKWTEVPKEFLDLSIEEKTRIEVQIKEKFSLQDKSLEGIIEESLGIVSDMGSIVQRSITLSQKIKALKQS